MTNQDRKNWLWTIENIAKHLDGDLIRFELRKYGAANLEDLSPSDLAIVYRDLKEYMDEYNE